MLDVDLMVGFINTTILDIRCTRPNNVAGAWQVGVRLPIGSTRDPVLLQGLLDHLWRGGTVGTEFSNQPAFSGFCGERWGENSTTTDPSQNSWEYLITQSFFEFDTSVIPDTANILSVEFVTYQTSAFAPSYLRDGNFELRLFNWGDDSANNSGGRLVSRADFRTLVTNPAYFDLPILGSYPVSNFNVQGGPIVNPHIIPGNIAFINAINKTGKTRFMGGQSTWLFRVNIDTWVENIEYGDVIFIGVVEGSPGADPQASILRIMYTS